MSISPQDINFYLTSLVPFSEQLNPASSIGGFVSTSYVYPSYSTLNDIGPSEIDINIDTADAVNYKFATIGNEIMLVNESSSGTINVDRAVNDIEEFHVANSKVFMLNDHMLFDNNFYGRSMSQYRCVAMTNDSSVDVMKNVRIYLRYKGQYPTSMCRIGVEIPRNNPIISTSSSGDGVSVIDTSLDGLYSNNEFDNSYLTFTSGPNAGQSRMILSYDASATEFIVDSSFPYSIGTDSFNVVTPIQRLNTIYDVPEKSQYFTGIHNFNYYNPIKIGLGVRGNNLGPGQSIYIWIERKVLISNYNVLNNSILTVVYDV